MEAVKWKAQEMGVLKDNAICQESFTTKTLCESCQKSTNSGCAWSDRLQPVKGWTVKKNANGYRVLKCPEYLQDEPRKGAKRKKGNIFASSPCETTCKNEKKNQCLQNNGRCPKYEKWFAENHVWQRTIEPLGRGTA